MVQKGQKSPKVDIEPDNSQPTKCSVMHMGKGNQKLKYNIGEVTLRASEEERDLGVIMHCSAKPSRQCVKAAIRGQIEYWK